MGKIAIALIACVTVVAADPKPFMDQIDVAKTERVSKEKAARIKLVEGLRREEKTAQSAGKLDLVLSIRGRLAELDGTTNPFDAKVEDIESTPVSESASEKIYAAEVNSLSAALAKKIASIFTQLDQKKMSATKAGKIDDALAYEGIMVAVKDELDKIKFTQPEIAKVEMSVDGTPMASVTISEEMGYIISTLGDGSLSHHNLSNKFAEVPAELKGKRYTQQTSNRTSSLKVTFETNGSIYILANSSWGGYANESKLLSKFAKKTRIKPVSNGSEKYEVWIATCRKGQSIETSNHTIVASEIKK